MVVCMKCLDRFTLTEVTLNFNDNYRINLK